MINVLNQIKCVFNILLNNLIIENSSTITSIDLLDIFSKIEGMYNNAIVNYLTIALAITSIIGIIIPLILNYKNYVDYQKAIKNNNEYNNKIIIELENKFKESIDDVKNNINILEGKVHESHLSFLIETEQYFQMIDSITTCLNYYINGYYEDIGIIIFKYENTLDDILNQEEKFEKLEKSYRMTLQNDRKADNYLANIKALNTDLVKKEIIPELNLLSKKMEKTITNLKDNFKKN